MAKYVDGFVFPIPKKNMPAYRKMAKIGRKTWMKHGALDYIESTLNDSPKKNQMGPGFAKMMKAKPSETVVFAFITFKSKAHRNAVNKRVHKEFSEMFAGQDWSMPFTMERFCYAGFQAFEQA